MGRSFEFHGGSCGGHDPASGGSSWGVCGRSGGGGYCSAHRRGLLSRVSCHVSAAATRSSCQERWRRSVSFVVDIASEHCAEGVSFLNLHGWKGDVLRASSCSSCIPSWYIRWCYFKYSAYS